MHKKNAETLNKEQFTDSHLKPELTAKSGLTAFQRKV